MPLYEYACKSCGKKIELMRSISDDSIVSCPDCKSECQKLISATSFQLKGTGWYKTDYSSGTSSNTNHGPACGSCCKTSDGTCKA
jgi:putative FmdB family regulatory protein